MKRMMLALAAALLAGPAAAQVKDASSVDAAGARVLAQSIEIAAPSKAVWNAVVDAETIRRWSAPMAVVDLSQGGSLEEGFSKDAPRGDPNNIRHDIIAYAPGRLLIYRNANAPAGLPGREAYRRLVGIVEVEDLGGGRTRLTLNQAGYERTAAFDALYAFFRQDNAQFLQSLKTALESPTGALHATAVVADPPPAPKIDRGVADASGVDAAGSPVLRLSADIEAPPARVFAAFTDPALMKRWMVKMAVVDLRQGGMIEDSYEAGAHPGDPENIKNQIIAYAPDRLMVFRNVQAPKALPGREAFAKVVAVLQVGDLGDGKTRLTITQMGVPAGDKDLYRFFLQGNALELRQLKAAFESPAGALR